MKNFKKFKDYIIKESIHSDIVSFLKSENPIDVIKNYNTEQLKLFIETIFYNHEVSFAIWFLKNKINIEYSLSYFEDPKGLDFYIKLFNLKDKVFVYDGGGSRFHFEGVFGENEIKEWLIRFIVDSWDIDFDWKIKEDYPDNISEDIQSGLDDINRLNKTSFNDLNDMISSEEFCDYYDNYSILIVDKKYIKRNDLYFENLLYVYDFFISNKINKAVIDFNGFLFGKYIDTFQKRPEFIDEIVQYLNSLTNEDIEKIQLDVTLNNFGI